MPRTDLAFAVELSDWALCPRNQASVARPTLSKLLNGHAGLSSEMALRFEKAFGLNAGMLMRMQIAHEMTEAREHLFFPALRFATRSPAIAVVKSCRSI